MTIREIVTDYLKANGFEGLCREGCGCGLEDFMPCDEPDEKCEPAYYHEESEDREEGWYPDKPRLI